MNVYEKVAEARLRLKKAGLKQSGRNKGLGYTYFDLCDILPRTTQIERELGLLSVVTFKETEGILTVYNTEKPEEQVVFTSPLKEAKVGSCQPVQNLGAMETYVRRYLYLLAYEIVETDALDSGAGKPEPKAEKPDESQDFAPGDYKCAVCGKAITKALFEQSLKKYGTPLCSAECRDKVKKAGELLGD